jgi:hypothetical protein
MTCEPESCVPGSNIPDTVGAWLPAQPAQLVPNKQKRTLTYLLECPLKKS